MAGPLPDILERNIEARTHGRFLVSRAPDHGLLLVGFHGYAETAADQIERLRQIPGSDRWTIVSIEGLHRFYRRSTNTVVASWMTRLHREDAIRDNLDYVDDVLGQVARDVSRVDRVVLAGFSQGVAMTFRAATLTQIPIAGVLASGGDVPPELDDKALSRIPFVLLGRGLRDEWFTAEKLAADENRLRAAGVEVEVVSSDAGHEWTAEFSARSGEFLAGLS